MTHRRITLLVLGAMGLGASLAACGEAKQQNAPPKSQDTPAPTAESKVTAPVVHDTREAIADGGAESQGPLIGALFLQTPIMSGMAWPLKDHEDPNKVDRETAVRIGYLRQGTKVPVIPEPHVKENCKEGWYELVQGGFVCGRYASIDLNHPKIRTGPHAPFTDGMLPYEYGYNIRHGTPLYRTVPSRDERLKLEPWLLPKKAKPAPREEETVSYYEDPWDAGATIQLTRTSQTTDPFGVTEPADSGVPWYLRDHDGGKPQVTLDDLRGEGPIARRMVRGFFVALDKEMSANNVKWWKTTGGLIAPHDRIYLHKTASEFHGRWLNDEAAQAKPIAEICKHKSKAQVAIVLYYKAKKYDVTASKKAVSSGDPVPRHTVVRLTGERVTINGARYEETDEGWWLKSIEATKTNPGEPPHDLKPGEKWIDVDLESQTLVAYEGDTPVYATAVSTGKEDKQDPDKDHKTPTGSWRIREKHIAATMDGDVASDGPYSIEDVPWIMYFNGSYALHGAFWHNNFGRTRSHGCVNLAPTDAKALFGWTEPQIPTGWHGVWSTGEKPGTRIVIHDESETHAQ